MSDWPAGQMRDNFMDKPYLLDQSTLNTNANGDNPLARPCDMKILKPAVATTAFLFAFAGRGDVTWTSVLPSETDSKIQDFDTPHWICVNEDILLGQSTKIKDRHEMLLFLPGTYGDKQGAEEFLETAANLGYHCVELMYPNDVSAAEMCADNPVAGSFESFRMAIIQGGRMSQYLTVDKIDSIENRLGKLLLFLQQQRPKENWGQFLNGGEIAWERIVVAGQSQGGGHAALIAVKYHVARVIMFGAPKDYSRALRQPAAWYSEPKATPISCFFAINHQQDYQGCSFPQLLENLQALGLDRLGAPVDVDQASPPYNHSHILVTNYPGTFVPSKTAHITALADKNKSVFRKAWIYMLTAATNEQGSLPR
jgi:hypothetical protein